MLYRKRFIPEEVLPLEDDEILLENERYLVTRWHTIKPRADFAWGISCYDLQKSYKVSRFMDEQDRLVYYYCDVVEWEAQGGDKFFTDLLADVIIHPDGSIHVVDLEEIADAREQGRITEAQANKALRILAALLKDLEKEGVETLFFRGVRP